jgi:hypothetical protein
MWGKACPLLTAVLGAGLVLTRRRLSDARAELERMRAEVGASGMSASGPLPPEPAGGSHGVPEPASRPPSETGSGAPDIAWEWEQAVAPMDS